MIFVISGNDSMSKYASVFKVPLKLMEAGTNFKKELVTSVGSKQTISNLTALFFLRVKYLEIQ